LRLSEEISFSKKIFRKKCNFPAKGGQGTVCTKVNHEIWAEGLDSITCGAESLPIKRWNRGKGTNRQRCWISSNSVAHGNALCNAKELGAVSKPALEHVIAVNLAMNFWEINRSGGSWGFVVGRIVLHLYPCHGCKVPAPLPQRRLSLVCLGADWWW
jgi:hypothetical protein